MLEAQHGALCRSDELHMRMTMASAGDLRMNMTHWTSRDASIVAPPRRQDVIVHEHGSDVVVSLSAEDSTFHLNETVAFVWAQCDGRRTTRDVATELTDRYDVPFDDALNDVEEIVVWLAESCLLKIVHDG